MTTFAARTHICFCSGIFLSGTGDHTCGKKKKSLKRESLCLPLRLYNNYDLKVLILLGLFSTSFGSLENMPERIHSVCTSICVLSPPPPPFLKSVKKQQRLTRLQLAAVWSAPLSECVPGGRFRMCDSESWGK